MNTKKLTHTIQSLTLLGSHRLGAICKGTQAAGCRVSYQKWLSLLHLKGHLENDELFPCKIECSYKMRDVSVTSHAQ